MSRESYQKNKILLDTSFLLPILGFDTSERIIKAFPKLRDYELHYSDLSILEALWKIVKKIRGTEEEISRVVEGIASIIESIKSAPITEGAVKDAINMYLEGHRDLIDNLLYATALAHGLKFLTVDATLKEFVETVGLPTDIIVFPEELSKEKRKN